MSLDRGTALCLLLKHRVMLLGWIRSIVRDEHVAEDVFQEVAIVVLNAYGKIRDEGHFPGWARKVAQYTALRTLRDAKRLPVVLDESVLAILESHWQDLDFAASADLTTALRECRKLLSPYADTLIRLRHERGLSGEAWPRRFSGRSTRSMSR